MPATGVRKRFAERCRSGKFTPVDLHGLARPFGVSFEAMARRLEDLKLLPPGSYEKIRKSRLRTRDLGPTETRRIARPTDLGLPERYVALAVSAHEQDLLSEVELADVLGSDIATARAVYQERSRISLDDGTVLPMDLGAADLRLP